LFPLQKYQLVAALVPREIYRSVVKKKQEYSNTANLSDFKPFFVSILTMVRMNQMNETLPYYFKSDIDINF